MDKKSQNQNQQNIIQQKLIKHIENRQRIKQQYQQKGIQMLDKKELILSDIKDQNLEPDQDLIYSTMKSELSEKGFSEYRYLGRGAQGLVILAKEKESNKRYAIKGIHIRDSKGNIHQKSVDLFWQEISILEQCKGSPYVVNFFGFIKGDDYYYIVLNECQGTLKQLIDMNQDKTLNELTAIKYAKDIAEGLCFIHSKKFLLNDLKFDNILIDYNGNAVISDFGLADNLAQYQEYSLNTYLGNILFQAPECYDPKAFDEYQKEYQKLNIIVKQEPSERSEAFSLGYLIYIMLQGFSSQLIFNKHKPVQYKPVFQNFVYEKQLKYIINGLTQFIPRQRLQIKEVLIILKGIISIEFQLDNQFVELIDIEDQSEQQFINSLNKNIELVECFKKKFYPIIKNEKQLIQQLNSKIQSQYDKVVEDLNIQIESLQQIIQTLLNEKEQNQISQINIQPFIQNNQQDIPNLVFNQQGLMNPQIKYIANYQQVDSKQEVMKPDNILKKEKKENPYQQKKEIQKNNLENQDQLKKKPVQSGQNQFNDYKKGYLYHSEKSGNLYVIDEEKNWIGLIKIKDENKEQKNMIISDKGQPKGQVSFIDGKKKYQQVKGIADEDFKKTLTELNCEYLLY